MFDERFDANAIRAAEMTPVHVVGLGRAAPDLAAAATSKAELEEAIKRRAIYNRGRYKAPAPFPVSGNVLRQAVSASGETALPTLEKNDDRTGNIFIAEALRAFEVSRKAIRRLALACGDAVRQIAALDRASESLERATRIFERVRPALIKRRGDGKSQSEGLKKGP